MKVETPRLLNQRRTLDFGPGFYLTSSLEQATRWAKAVQRRRKSGDPYVNVYDFDEQSLLRLRVLRFDTANGEWLDYVVQNRLGEYIPKDYDIVIGPVANDSTLPVIDNYMAGVYTKEEAVRRLLPQNLTDQYAFKSEVAISMLTYKEGDKK